MTPMSGAGGPLVVRRKPYVGIDADVSKRTRCDCLRSFVRHGFVPRWFLVDHLHAPDAGAPRAFSAAISRGCAANRVCAFPRAQCLRPHDATPVARRRGAWTGERHGVVRSPDRTAMARW